MTALDWLKGKDQAITEGSANHGNFLGKEDGVVEGFKNAEGPVIDLAVGGGWEFNAASVPRRKAWWHSVRHPGL